MGRKNEKSCPTIRQRLECNPHTAMRIILMGEVRERESEGGGVGIEKCRF
jgi:hypothetical protein